MAEKAPTFEEQFDGFEDSPGERVSRHLMGLKTVARIVGTNSSELREALLDLNRPELLLRLWRNENRELLREYHREVIRLLHNYLAAVATYRDHTRAFVNRFHASGAFSQEYSERAASTFKRSEVGAFIMDLRNYTLHKGLPASDMVLTVQHPRDGGRAENSVVLRLDVLTAWTKWTSLAKSFLATQSADINLLSVIDQYDSVLQEFYTWFGSRLHELHAADFAESERLHRKLVQMSTR